MRNALSSRSTAPRLPRVCCSPLDPLQELHVSHVPRSPERDTDSPARRRLSPAPAHFPPARRGRGRGPEGGREGGREEPRSPARPRPLAALPQTAPWDKRDPRLGEGRADWNSPSLCVSLRSFSSFSPLTLPVPFALGPIPPHPKPAASM